MKYMCQTDYTYQLAGMWGTIQDEKITIKGTLFSVRFKFFPVLFSSTCCWEIAIICLLLLFDSSFAINLPPTVRLISAWLAGWLAGWLACLPAWLDGPLNGADWKDIKLGVWVYVDYFTNSHYRLMSDKLGISTACTIFDVWKKYIYIYIGIKIRHLNIWSGYIKIKCGSLKNGRVINGSARGQSVRSITRLIKTK